jgi:hypothetical protein
MFSSGDDRSWEAGLIHFVGADQVDDRVDERHRQHPLRHSLTLRYLMTTRGRSGYCRTLITF